MGTCSRMLRVCLSSSFGISAVGRGCFVSGLALVGDFGECEMEEIV